MQIEYRLNVCPELCYGLFARAGTSNPQITARPTLNVEAGSEEDELIAHTISTKSNTRAVKDEDMVIATNWQTDPKADHGEGHRPTGRSLALHSLAVAPAHQSLGFGKALMKAYIEQMRQEDDVDRISILTYDRLVPYYKKLGFTHYGKSASEYAGIAWHDLVRLQSSSWKLKAY